MKTPFMIVIAAGMLVACTGPLRKYETSGTPATIRNPVALLKHQVKVEGHSLAVHEKSIPGARDVILLVHGRTWSSMPDFDLQVAEKQRSLMDALVRVGFTAYAVDMRGYGDTPRDATGWLTPRRAAADLAGVMRWVSRRHESLDAPSLLGWSYGSLISQLVAQHHPELTSNLILYGYPRDSSEVTPVSHEVSVPPRIPNTARAAAEDFLNPDVIDASSMDAFVDRALQADPVRMDWKNLHEWNTLDPGKVTVPTLLIHGALDPYASPDQQAELFNNLGTSDRAWVSVSTGTHCAHLEDTMHRFVQAVDGFIHRLEIPNPASD